MKWKEFLKDIFSEEFAMECLEGLAADSIEQLLGKNMKSIIDKICMKLAIKKVGGGDNQKELKELIKTYESNPEIYSDDELNAMFESAYNKLQQKSENFTVTNKEELREQFKTYVTQCTKAIKHEITDGQKIILEKVDGIDIKISNVQCNTEEATKILQQMSHEANMPYLDIMETTASVNEFSYKYTVLQNVYDYVEEIYNQETEPDVEGIYVFSFRIKNICKI